MAHDVNKAGEQVSAAIQRAKYKPRDTIPVLTAHPDVEDGITLYLDPNGNLRAMAPDGSIYQYTKTTLTSPSGSFPADPMPEMFTATYAAAWARAFCATHGVESVPFPGYGDDPTNTHGYRKIMIGFPSATIQTDLAGATIDDVELGITNVDAFVPQVTLHIGWHDQTSAPTAYSATRAETVQIEVPRVGHVWAPVDDVFGTALRDNLYDGITIEQPGGFTDSGAIDWAATEIRINYTV
jgi:hypothetical protein